MQGNGNASQSDAPLPVMPNVNITASGRVAITGKQSWGRAEQPLLMILPFIHVSRVKLVVLGPGEFVRNSLLVAERIERQGLLK